MTVTESRRVTADDFNDVPSFTEHPLPPLPDAPRPEPWHLIEPPPLRIVTLEEFAAVKEASADPLLGTTDNNLLAAGAISVIYGDGGAGKTTLFLDVAFHLATASNWLGLDVPQRSRVLWIENEGPRGMFRQKTDVKQSNWPGPDLNSHFHVLEEPWSLFTFAKPQHRHELAQHVDELDIQVVIAGPVQRLGVTGGGTPAEVGQFIQLVEETRNELGRPLAFVFIHHENKSGDVSGAWEGIPDTLLHVFPQGNGKTRVHWQKARWAPDVHGKTWHLLWQDGDTFKMDETPENTDEEVRLSILEAVKENPGSNWNALDGKIKGKGARKRAVRDLLLDEGTLVNEPRKGGAMALYLSARPEGDADGTQTSFHPEETEKSGPRPASRRIRRDAGDAVAPAPPDNDDPLPF